MVKHFGVYSTKECIVGKTMVKSCLENNRTVLKKKKRDSPTTFKDVLGLENPEGANAFVAPARSITQAVKNFIVVFGKTANDVENGKCSL